MNVEDVGIWDLWITKRTLPDANDIAPWSLAAITGVTILCAVISDAIFALRILTGALAMNQVYGDME